MSSPHPATTPSRAKLFTQQGLQDLRAQLFRLELSAVHQMIDAAVSTPPASPSWPISTGPSKRSNDYSCRRANGRSSMAWRRRDRRGRPRKANARRRATTVAGRAPPPGSRLARAGRPQACASPDARISRSTGAAVLFGHDHLDRAQYDTLGRITELLQRVARAWGGQRRQRHRAVGGDYRGADEHRLRP